MMMMMPPDQQQRGQQGVAAVVGEVIGEEDDDTHFCLRCRITVSGLEEYVRHRRAGCGPKQEQQQQQQQQQYQQQQQQEQQQQQQQAKEEEEEDEVIKADDFFSQLELQSSSKKAGGSGVAAAAKTAGMLTRSKSSGGRRGSPRAARLPAERAKKQRKRLQSGTSEEEEEEDPRVPPRTHTGGKWRPRTPAVVEQPPAAAPAPTSPPPSAGGKWGPPPPSHTGGKWRPSPMKEDEHHHEGGRSSDLDRDLDLKRGRDLEQEHEEDESSASPPPSHTRGKWAPGMASKVRAVLMGSGTAMESVRKSGSTVQYWCGSCNRRLASSKLYARHLQSDLHLKRTLPERQLDVNPAASEPPWEPLWEHPEAPRERLSPAKESPRRGHRAERCPVCRARVHRHQVGKHLVSHFHWRSARRARSSAAGRLVLDNIEAVVRQSPFQCGLCRFYCNSSASFRLHWASAMHRDRDRQGAGQYWCSPCELGRPTSDLMEEHLWSDDHREVEAAVNRSVAVVVSRRTSLRCATPGCAAEFRYNLELARHERLFGHGGSSSTAGDRYQERHRCGLCGVQRRSRLALQKHKLKCHATDIRSGVDGCYYCSVCSLTFPTATLAAQHRMSRTHRDSVRDQQRSGSSGSAARRCPHCGLQCRGLTALRLHLEDKHPDKKHRCALCGLAFTLPQQVSRHAREVHAAAAAPAAATAPLPPPEVLIPADVPPPYVCPPCSFSTDSRAEMMFHGVLHADPPSTGAECRDVRYRCPICPKSYRKVALRAHLRVHTGERPFQCRHCHRGFSRKDSCVTHEQTMHAQDDVVTADPQQQQQQGRQDGEQRQLQDAILSIVDLAPGSSPAARPGRRVLAPLAAARERKHLCDVCGKCFFNKSTLRQHQVSVHGVKPLQCSWPDCQHRARSAAELRVHTMSHSGERPLQCNDCDFRARTKQMLKRHQTIHSGEKAFKCEHCDFATRVGSHLVRHRRVHTGAKPYCCPHCSYRCNNLENLRKHVLQTNKHPGKYMYECPFGNGDGTPCFLTNLATDFRSHLSQEHADRFRSVAAAASFVAGIYDSAFEAEQPINLVLPQKRRSRKRGQRSQDDSAEAQPSRVTRVTRVPRAVKDRVDEVSQQLQHTKSTEEDVPTSLLPQHELEQCLDGDLFPVVVTDCPNDVIFIQLEEGGDKAVVLQDDCIPTQASLC